MTKMSMAAAALPASGEDALRRLGENLLIAIKRRHMKRAEVAERALISLPTLRAVLRGDPTTGMGAYAAVLAVLGLDEDLAKVAAPAADEVGQALAQRQLPQRVRSKDSQYDF